MHSPELRLHPQPQAEPQQPPQLQLRAARPVPQRAAQGSERPARRDAREMKKRLEVEILGFRFLIFLMRGVQLRKSPAAHCRLAVQACGRHGLQLVLGVIVLQVMDCHRWVMDFHRVLLVWGCGEVGDCGAVGEPRAMRWEKAHGRWVRQMAGLPRAFVVVAVARLGDDFAGLGRRELRLPAQPRLLLLLLLQHKHWLQVQPVRDVPRIPHLARDHVVAASLNGEDCRRRCRRRR